MQDPADPERTVWKNSLGPLESKIANRDEPLRLESSHCGAEVVVASCKQIRPLGRRQFIGRAVSATAFQESQRAIIQHKMLGKELVGAAKPLREQAP